jgi:hypothetical protein
MDSFTAFWICVIGLNGIAFVILWSLKQYINKNKTQTKKHIAKATKRTSTVPRKTTSTVPRDAHYQRKGIYYNNDGTYTNNYLASDEAEDDFFYELDHGDEQEDL